MKIKLDKEYKIKINNNVLEKFEEEAEDWKKPVSAFQFDQRNMKQLKLMTRLAIEEAGGSISNETLMEHISLSVAVPITEEYFKCCLGKEGQKLADEVIEDKGK